MFRWINLNIDILQVMEKSKYFQKPNNNNDYNNNIEDTFNCMIHRDESINEPKDNPGNN